MTLAQTTRRLLVGAALVLSLGNDALAGDERRFKSGAYDITTDLPEEQAAELARHMDAVHAEYTRRFAKFGKRNAEPLRLWVFETQQGYMEFLAGHEINAIGSGGMFFRRDDASGLASFLGNRPESMMYETLRHEGMHQFLYQRIGDTLPTWLNEGMAEWFGYALPTERGFEMGLADPHAIARLQKAAENDTLLPLESLLTMSHREWNERVRSGGAGGQYDQAWSVVHFLAYSEGGRYAGMLDQLLGLFWQGYDPPRAVRAVFGSDLAPMEAKWKAYIESLEPDELYAARDMLDAWGLVLAALDQAGVRPKTLEEFDAALIVHGATLDLPKAMTTTAGEMELSLVPDAWWRTPPNSAKTGRPAMLRLIPDRRGREPVTIELRGLKRAVRLEWKENGEGKPSPSVMIR